ncbi:MAG TPA: ABC transporter substrate-binding protein [Nocardioidaceae bacterium]|nr:ABC transporter substrate-binding protein [Nocardioidaceae bacterium]
MLTKTRLVALATVVAAMFPLSACGGDPTASGGSGSGGSSTITVGSANFPENELLAEMYSQSLEAKDVKVTRKFNIGARELYLKALKDGSIDMIPEYNGALLAALSPGGTVPNNVSTPEEVLAALQKVLPKGTETTEQSAAEDKDTLTVTSETANKYHLKKIDDLKPVASKFILGAGPEFAKRYQGVVGLKKLYGLTFKEFKPLDPGGPLTKAALKKGDIQVANIFSTDSTIETDKLVVLDDTKNLFLAQNVVPVIRSSKVNADVKSALNDVSKALTTEDLTKYLAEVAVDKKDPQTVAKEFLDANNIG